MTGIISLDDKKLMANVLNIITIIAPHNEYYNVEMNKIKNNVYKRINNLNSHNF